MKNYIVYLIFLIVFISFLIVPLYFEYVGPYSSPTSVYALQIIQDGKIVDGSFISNSAARLKDDVTIETYYPFPSIILAVFGLVTNIPLNYLMFLPITGLASIIFFVLARKLIPKEYGSILPLFLPVLYYLYVMSPRVYALYVGRAVLGVSLLAFFLFCYSVFLHKYARGEGQRLPWFILSCIFAVAIGCTYYSSSLAIIIITLMTAVIPISNGLFTVKKFSYAGLSIFCLSIFLFIRNNYFSSLVGTVEDNDIFNNWNLYFQMRFGGVSENINVLTDLYPRDPLISNLQLFSSIVTALSLIALLVVLIMKRPRINNMKSCSLIWVFAALVFLAGLSEFAYGFERPSFIPTRFYGLFGLILLLYLFIEKINGFKHSTRLKTLKRIAVIIMILLLMLASLGSLYKSYDRGIAGEKQFAYSQLLPLGEFTSKYCSEKDYVSLIGDSYFVANMNFISSLNNSTNKIISEPLGRDAITLFNWSLTKQSADFLDRMDAKRVDYLLFVQTTKPYWGDGWGYITPPPNGEVFYNDLSCVYTSGYLQLFRK